MKQRYEGVDCLRIVAIFIIILYHIWALGGMGSFNGYMLPYGGEIGVTLFLVLSGFSMYVVIEKESENEAFSYKKFIKGRFQKIAPQYYASIILALLFTNAAAWLSVSGLKDIFTHLFFIHNLFPSTHGSISGVLWTMGLIVQFYLLAPLLYKLVAKKAWLVAIFSMILVILSKYVTLSVVDEYWASMYDRQIWTALDSFILGEVAAKYLLNKCNEKNRNKRRWIGVFWVGVTITWIRIGQKYGIHVPTLVGCTWHSGLSLCFCILIILWGDVVIPCRMKRTIGWLVKNEYSIYIWHLLIINNLLNNSPLIAALCEGQLFLAGVFILIMFTLLWSGAMTKGIHSIEESFSINFLKQNNIKKIFIGKVHLLYILLIILCALFSVNFGNIAGTFANLVHPEYVIKNDEFTSDKVWLKDFILLEDGSIQSTSVCPWIYVGFAENGLEKPVNLRIDVESATNENKTALVYYVDTYQVQALSMESGEHIIPLNLLTKQDFGLRLDLTSRSNEIIKVNQIIFNDVQYITQRWRARTLGWLIWLIMMGIAFFLKKKREKECILTFSQVIYTRAILIFYMVLGLYFAYYMFEQGITASNMWENLFFVILFFIFTASYVYNRFDLGAWALFGLFSQGILQYKLNDYALVNYIKNFLVTPVLILNILFVLLLIVTIQQVLGKQLGNLIVGNMLAVYVIANIVKMKFQNALLRAADLKLGGEIVRIIGYYVNNLTIFCALMGIAAGIFLMIRFRKRLISYFKPRFSFWAIPLIVVVGLLNNLIFSNGFKQWGINVDAYYLNDQQQINQMGFGMYSLMEFTGNQKSNEPEGYGDGIVEDVDLYKDKSTENDAQPIVILILAESLFDVEGVPNLMFNQSLLPNLQKYKVADLLSPSYGGRTVVAEYEVVTGMSNVFIDGNNSAYNAYLNKTGRNTGSLAREFSKAGYASYAIHANEAKFYCRDAAYINMGFEDFISKEDFQITPDDCLNDGMIKDEVFVDKIIEVLEGEERPTFILGVSFESHGPYMTKYESTDVKAFSDVYGEDTLHEISNYGQAIYNFDQQMGRLMDYLDQCGQEALLYIFGDHLPAIALNEEDGYLNDIWKKYNTPLYAYSNYCDVEIEDTFVSMNQIAPEILRKSGIEHSAYFDFIYQLRRDYPVIHKELGIDYSDEKINLYNKIYWDLLFGEKYLLQ